MDVTELKALEAQAKPAPWDGIPLSLPNLPFVVALRNVTPELLELWDAVAKQQAAPEGRKCHSTTLCKAFDALEKKAASMAV